jgi:hypothetical protein
MKVEVTVEELQKRKIFLGTPMYGGVCEGTYTKSMTDLSALCTRYGVDMRLFFLFNESLITRARNYTADEFLRSDMTHLMFIDADIGFDANDVLTLAAIADPNSDKDIVCGPYPKKTIAWEKIKKAVDKGFADENPNNLENFVGDYVFNPVEGTNQISLGEPAEVAEGGTGFMMIQRRVFEKFAEAYPQQLYTPDHVRTKHFDGTRQIMSYFDTVIDPKTNRYLSEDYMFCQWARAIGIKVWMCPWIKLQHAGKYNFGGSLEALAQIGVTATADAKDVRK